MAWPASDSQRRRARLSSRSLRDCQRRSTAWTRRATSASRADGSAGVAPGGGLGGGEGLRVARRGCGLSGLGGGGGVVGHGLLRGGRAGRTGLGTGEGGREIGLGHGLGSGVNARAQAGGQVEHFGGADGVDLVGLFGPAGEPAGEGGAAFAQQRGEVEPQTAQAGGVGDGGDALVALAGHEGAQFIGGGDAAEVPVRETLRRGLLAGDAQAAGRPLAARRAAAGAMPVGTQQEAAADGFLIEALADEASVGGRDASVASRVGHGGQAGALEAVRVGFVEGSLDGAAGGPMVGGGKGVVRRVVVARGAGGEDAALVAAPDGEHVSLSLRQGGRAGGPP